MALAISTDASDLSHLLNAVRSCGYPCAVFLTSDQARDAVTVQSLVEVGCEVGLRLKRGTKLGILRKNETIEQIDSGLKALVSVNLRPRVLTAPKAHSGPALWPALLSLGMKGLRPAIHLSWGRLTEFHVEDGAIMRLHFPNGLPEKDMNLALTQVASGVRKACLTLHSLSYVLRWEVLSAGRQAGATEVFYDSLAACYDEEQDARGQHYLRRVERDLVEKHVLSMFKGQERVLELGAGTGRFSLLLAKHAQKVVAVDVSPQMLSVLNTKALADGISCVDTACGDMEGAWPKGPFDWVCSMSALEYVADLDGIVAQASDKLTDGGRLYFITAHRTPFRWFTQIGNAVRQGIWLHARRARRLQKLLEVHGFESIRINSHGLRLPVFGGMLLEVSARKVKPQCEEAPKKPTCRARIARPIV